MQLAIEAMRRKVIGLKHAVKQFGVPRSTLQRRCKTVGDVAVTAEKGLGRFRPVFSPAMELELVVHIKRMESMLFGFTLSQLKRVAYDCTEANGIQRNFKRRTGEDG